MLEEQTIHIYKSLCKVVLNADRIAATSSTAPFRYANEVGQKQKVPCQGALLWAGKARVRRQDCTFAYMLIFWKDIFNGYRL